MKKENEKVILRIKKFLEGEGIMCGNLEYTSGNYDNDEQEILEKVPTITCELGEIGIVNNSIYLTIIFPKASLSQELLNIVKEYEGTSIYPFINFKKTLYPSETNSLEYVKEGLEKEEYFQVNMGFKRYVQNIVKQILLLKKILDERDIKYINQLTDTLNS